MKFKLIDSGSKGNACLIYDDHNAVLLDCGSTKRQLTKHLMGHRLDGLVLTHNHRDHVQQLDQFPGLFVYAPFAVREPSQDVCAFKPFTLGGFVFLPLPLSHDCSNTMGYRISKEDRSLVYITDTGYLTEAVVKACYGANAIILESNHDVDLLMQSKRPYSLKQRILSETGHLSNHQAAYYLSQMVTPATQQIILAHVSLEANQPDLVLAEIAQALPTYQGSIRVAQQRVCLEGEC